MHTGLPLRTTGFMLILGLPVFLSESCDESRLPRINVALGGDLPNFKLLRKGAGVNLIFFLLLCLVTLDGIIAVSHY